MRRLLLLVIVIAALATGCSTSGGASDSSDDPPVDPVTVDPDEPTEPEPEPEGGMAEEYEMALVEQFTAVEEGELELTQTEAECVAPLWLEAMTVEALEEAEVTTEELADTSFIPGDLELGDDAGQAMVDAFDECDVPLAELAVEALASGDSELEDCVNENLDADALLDLLARDLGGEDTDADFDELFAPVEAACEPS